MITLRNRGGNKRYITIADRRMRVADWARELGQRPAVIHSRLHMGWSEFDALNEPVEVYKPRVRSSA